ncbi:MAG: maleylpyruvate isomerase family mycothiol-dependent enzyme [Micromonosporaceae bacterium]
MDSADYLSLLRHEFDRFAACLDGDLTARVAHCGDWTLHDLADHLGGGNLWAATAITERRGDLSPDPAPQDHEKLRSWYAETCDVLLAALHADPQTEAWTFYPPHTVGFWRRRRYLETLIHRWDAEHALGVTPSLDPVRAADGVAEVFQVMAPRMVARGRATAPPAAVRFTASDTGDSVTYGPGEPVATVSAPAAQLLLMLWGRLPADDPTIACDGDRDTARAILTGPLTP